MEDPQKNQRVGKIHRKMDNMDLNEVNSRTSYNKYYTEKSLSRSEQGEKINNDNLSQKSDSNSVQTSYQYRRNKNGPNSISSKNSYNHNHQQQQQDNKNYDEESSISISENDNLICANCINSTLIEEKQKRNNLDNNHNYNSDGFLFDDNRNYERDLIDERRRQREYNTNEAIQNLARINAEQSNKDKLIQLNENSRNPLNEGGPDYNYQKFQDEYNRKQKMINDNINKYHPNSINERPEVASYYDNYVYNNKNKNKNNKYNDEDDYNYNNKPYGKNYNPVNDRKRQEYLKDLEDQINYKNEMKRREKEEDKKREQQHYEDIQREMKKEEEEKLLKEQKQKKELLEANMELINQKNKMKMKELEDKKKYREYYDRQNEEYQKELKDQQLEKEKRRNDIYNDNRNEYENRKRMKDQEKYNDMKNNINNIDKENEDLDEHNKNHEKERMGRCCRCKRIFPRRLLTINRYFYQDNRK